MCDFNIAPIIKGVSYVVDTKTKNDSMITGQTFKKRYRFPGYFAPQMNDFYIEKVLYKNPRTIVFWSDGDKTVSKVHADDVYNPEVGLILCIIKKMHGPTKVHDILDAWIPKNYKIDGTTVTVADVRKNSKEKKNKKKTEESHEPKNTVEVISEIDGVNYQSLYNDDNY